MNDCIPDSTGQRCIVCGWDRGGRPTFPRHNCVIETSEAIAKRRPTQGGSFPSRHQDNCKAGSELHRLLGRMGLKPSGDCLCHQRMAVMDDMGCDWCDQNVETIIGWMVEEAKRRSIPFADTVLSRAAAELLVKRAIKRAREKERSLAD